MFHSFNELVSSTMRGSTPVFVDNSTLKELIPQFPHETKIKLEALLAEKQITLEQYRAQTVALASAPDKHEPEIVEVSRTMEKSAEKEIAEIKKVLQYANAEIVKQQNKEESTVVFPP